MAYVHVQAQPDASGLVLRPAPCLMRPAPSLAHSAPAPTPRPCPTPSAQLHAPNALVKSGLVRKLSWPRNLACLAWSASWPHT
ncbi:unnamed protein product [Lupinus luteus]|uniref:Uncharacterized protein n=1 Tax=Lupinus luteus TaxID=3873 RepID=A0AAV1WJY1_LUPLU